MVDVKITIGNEEARLIESRLRSFIKDLAGDITAGGGWQKGATSATATRAFLSRLVRQLQEHQRRLEETARQEKENRDRISAGKR